MKIKPDREFVFLLMVIVNFAFADFLYGNPSNKITVNDSLTDLDHISLDDLHSQLIDFCREENASDSEYIYWLFNAARFHDLDEDPKHAACFYQALAKVMNDGLEIKKRRSELVKIPSDTEGLYALTSKNYASLKSTIGHLYSLSKYGDGDALDFFARKIANRIRIKYGDNIYDGTWLIANTSYYRVLNTAAALTKKVGEILNLPSPQLNMHIKPKKSHLGEFGTINTFSQRYHIMKDAFHCTNEELIKGKNVIYIDDLFASGMHVMEHIKILERFEAKSVHAIGIVDVLDTQLNLEGLINFSTVKVDQPMVAVNELINIYDKQNSIVVMRSLKLMMKMPRAALDLLLAGLSKERIFEIVEASENEGYDNHPEFKTSFEYIRAFANGLLKPNNPQKQAKIVFTHYYGSIVPSTNDHLDGKRAKILTDYLKEGKILVVSSKDGIVDEPNLFSKFINPLRRYIKVKKIDLSILKNLIVFGGNDLELINFDKNGKVKNQRSWDFGRSEQDLLIKSINNSFKTKVAKIERKNRGLEVQLKQDQEREQLIAAMKEKLEGFFPYLAFIPSEKKSTGISIFNMAGKKTIARDYILNDLRARIFEKTGELITRDEIMVVSNKFNFQNLDNNGTGMFIYGAINHTLDEGSTHNTEKKFEGLYGIIKSQMNVVKATS